MTASVPGPTVVFGATGLQGGSVARTLIARGMPVRAVVRDVHAPQALALARLGVDLFAGNLADPASVSSAMRGARSVFSFQPSSGQAGSPVTDEQEISFGTTVVEMAERHQIKHLVYSSAIVAAYGLTGIAHFDTKVTIENKVRDSSVPITTIIRPATFMEFLQPSTADVAAGLVSFLMHPDQALQFLPSSDIGPAVAKILATPGSYRGRSLALAGDELTGHQMAAAVATHTGSPLRYTRIPTTILRQELPLLGQLADLADAGPLAGDASLPDLRSEFPFLRTFHAWLHREENVPSG